MESNLPEELKNRFIYHPPDAGKAIRHLDIRVNCTSLANILYTCLPDSREKSLALTKLEEVMFWANAAIARHIENMEENND